MTISRRPGFSAHRATRHLFSRQVFALLLAAAVLVLGATSDRFLPLTRTALAATFTVSNANDDGAGSLRAAITSANATAGADTITFDITGPGPHTIQLASALP